MGFGQCRFGLRTNFAGVIPETPRLSLLSLCFALTAVLAQAQSAIEPAALSEAEQRDYAWLLLISEPADTLSATPLTQLDDEVLAGLALPAHLATEHSLPVFAVDAEQKIDVLTITQMAQLATAYRLRRDAPQAAFWYGQLVERSPDPRYLYFHSQALRESGFSASAKRVLRKYEEGRLAAAH